MENKKSPGERLKDLLKKLIPLKRDTENFVSYIDDILKADTEFEYIVYESCINYLLRRLITTATFFKKKYTNDFYTSGRYTTELRRFLEKETRFDKTRVEEILTLLQECLEIKESYFSSHTKNRLLKNQKKCYICGTDLLKNNNVLQTVNFAEITGGKLDVIQKEQYFSINIKHITKIGMNNPSDGKKLTVSVPMDGELNTTTIYSPYSPEVEHIWPRAMGGTSDEENLALSCSECNGDKQDFIDASDFHYEEICLANCDETSDEFKMEFKRNYKLALWSKSNFKCEICDLKAEDLGQLEFIRKNPNDSWHFLNISVLCRSCARKLKK
jgi:hypothetical protein